MKIGYRNMKRLKHQSTVAACYILAVIFFFPIFWMVLTSFKTELQAISVPPLFFFEPTLENFSIVQERSEDALAAAQKAAEREMIKAGYY